MSRGLLFIFLSFSTLFVFSGCAGKGEVFTAFKEPVNDNGLLYIYRPDRFTGMVVSYDVKDKHTQEVIGTLRNSSFISKSLPAGRYTLITPSDELDITIEKNRITCLTSYIDMVHDLGIGFATHVLKPVPIIQCRDEIKQTNESL
ncbi:hypothetical protein WCX49_01765 [Sulfurimonas sp. HSL-1656]|uniref:hypothetical protein n=1 Tax=Thiomicrolovo subterrani TaxID=3131934 RepID=UPI0031F7E199